MKKTYMAVCPRCFEFYSVYHDPSTCKCDDCKTALQLVDHDYELYSQLTPDEKTAFKKVYIEEHFPGVNPYIKPFEPMPSNGWSSYISFLGWATVIIVIVAGVFACLSGAVLPGLGLIIAGPASGGALILLSIIAEDVRHIRNQVDRMHYEKENHQ